MKETKQETIHITSEAGILSAFKNLTSYDKRTLLTWIHFFKRCMYYASSDYSNPAFLSLAYNGMKKSDQYPQEFLYIHKLMYQFLCLGTPCFLQFQPYEDLTSKYDPAAFKWNVPVSVMPFLICYIKAASKFKKAAPVTSFFNELDETFAETERLQSNLTRTEYRNLTDKILCRKYFCTAEEIYNTFAKNDSQKEAIRHCIFYLTQTLIAFPQNRGSGINSGSPTAANACILLETFRENLYEQTRSENKKTDLSPLYPRKKPWSIIGEKELIESITHSLSFFSAKAFSFAEEALDFHSPYHISAKDYDAFSVGCTKIIDNIERQVEKEKEEVTAFYFNLINEPTISRALSNGRLELDQESLNYRYYLLIDALTTFANSFVQTILTFKNNVRKASHASPEQYISLKTDKDYFSEFKQSIKAIERKLFGKNFMTAFEHSKPFLFYNDRGLVHDLTYPAVLFPQECLKITYGLTGNYLVSEDYILQYFRDKKIHFPISFAEFLLQVDLENLRQFLGLIK